ncbi:Acyl dehydratase [Brevibacterium sandarakinum]|uniref:Acyl dehydratase n=1 Tax=Brevibacterium sandarakinum TaxID=629680 RepID=A0A1H1SAR8_BRESA|nr:MaoC family dehydratase [Brevibacterium sandarakinum]SDS44973.1 Acyl dehydratase [Brevibacterium sandarakinum]
MAGKYFEELELGWTIEHDIKKTVTETDNVLFSALTLNLAPLHIDAHYAAETEFGKPLVNSLYTLGLVCGISVADTTLGTTVANLGFGKITFPAPVFAGDTVNVETTVVAHRESRSRQDSGIVTFSHTGKNQDGVVVCECERAALMSKSHK